MTETGAGRGPIEERRRVALDRFARFFDELRGRFLERDDVLVQMALALLAREHVMIMGPPGTGKSLLASSVVGRVVCADTGEPSLFAKQFTESTVQTELIGAVNFKTLTETGRTEHFTDEGMLGAVHAFLDEVLDGRDMLLRSTLNLLEERELKQGTKITRGRIECAVMTSNRYLTEALESSRNTLLAFVDRIAFVCFVPRGFAEPKHLDRVVESTLSSGMILNTRLTIQDVDVLQEMVDEVEVPRSLSRAVVALARDFEERAGQLERSDPSFVCTRYLSTRAVIRLAKLLRAIVVLDKATARRQRPLLAELPDLGTLRLGMMLAGPRPEHIDALLERETEPRERRQLHIMKCEAEIFSDCIRDLEPEDVESDEPEEEEAPDVQEVATEQLSPSGPTREQELAEAVMALSGAPGDLQAVELALEASLALERQHPRSRAAAESARGHTLDALSEAVAMGGASARGAASREAVDAHLSRLEAACRLRERLLAAEVSSVDRVAVNARFTDALTRLGAHCDSAFDAMAYSAVQSSLTGDGYRNLSALLGAIEPLLIELRELDARYLALSESSAPPSEAVLGRRIAPALKATYAQLRAPDRKQLAALVDDAMNRLDHLGLAAAIPLSEHLLWIGEALTRGEPALPEAAKNVDAEAYRRLRGDENRTPIAVALAELLAVLRVRAGGLWTPSLEAMASTLKTLPESLRAQLAAIDLDRIERAIELLEAWSDSDGHGDDDALTRIAFDEGALLRFTLECRVVETLFPDCIERSTELGARLRSLGQSMRGRLTLTRREAMDERWVQLSTSSSSGS